MVADSVCLVWLCIVSQGDVPLAPAGLDTSDDPAGSAAVEVLPLPPPLPARSAPESGVEWSQVAKSSLRFLGVMHAFRWATEADTRAGGVGLGSSYLRSVSNLHGWADGDPFYVNYMGHPAQGAISGRLFLMNDRRYRATEFGRNPDYWKGRLRAAAFSWAFSEQFEIGLLSEASIGRVQSHFPQQGFVDHVITPTAGLAGMVIEDWLDKSLIKPLEGRIHNKWMRLALRTAMNPTRSFANVMNAQVPWHRDTRGGVMKYEPPPRVEVRAMPPDEPKPDVAPFEFSVASRWRQFPAGGCIGGGAEAAYRVSNEWQLVLDVDGCKLLGLPANVSGDALVYELGPRWTPSPAGKWSPYAHVLVGGMKITHEQLYPDTKKAVEEANPNIDPLYAYKLHDEYTTSEESNGLTFTAGTGVDYKLSNALAIRVAGVEYSHSTAGSVGGFNYSRGLEVRTGMVLRLGTW